MNKQESSPMNFFERHLTVWVGLCILAGIDLGKLAPDLAKTLDGMSIFVDGAPVVSIPIAICLFFMMYPIMVKIDFGEVVKAGRNPKPVLLTLIVNWGIKPFTMLGIATLFLGGLFKDLPARHGGGQGRHHGGTLPLLHFRSNPARHRALHRDGAGVELSGARATRATRWSWWRSTR